MCGAFYLSYYMPIENKSDVKYLIWMLRWTCPFLVYFIGKGIRKRFEQ